jgi:hypothetical protein
MGCVSSRSNVIIEIEIKQTDKDSNEMVSVVNLVDLSGSENNQNKGSYFKEVP